MKPDSDTHRPPCLPQLLFRLVAVRRYTVSRCGGVEARLWRLRIPAPPPSEDRSAHTPRREIAYAVELWGLGTRRVCLLEGDETYAREILDLLARNTVTPCALRDVLEEL